MAPTGSVKNKNDFYWYERWTLAPHLSHNQQKSSCSSYIPFGASLEYPILAQQIPVAEQSRIKQIASAIVVRRQKELFSNQCQHSQTDIDIS